MNDPSGLKPGQLFKTMDAAAKDFAKIYNKISIKKDKEYASFIYKKTKKNIKIKQLEMV
jgi:hypothetical protein